MELLPNASGLLADLFALPVSPLDKVVRTVLVYLAIAVLLRIAGKRLLAQMNNLDLVVVLLLSNVVQNAIIGPDNSITGGVIGAVVLVLVNAGADRLMQRSRVIQWLVEGRPTTVIVDGRVDEAALRRLGTSPHELAAALHHQGADTVDEVENARVEPGGLLQVTLRPEERAVSKSELDAAVAELKAAILAARA